MTSSDEPFGTIESAQQFLALLSEKIDEAADEVRRELTVCTTPEEERRKEAWQLVLYTMTKLSSHIRNGRRLMNDLRTLRNLLHRNSHPEHIDAAQMVPAAPGALGRPANE
jgi:hypothetical protein